jgi:hypothetical protein
VGRGRTASEFLHKRQHRNVVEQLLATDAKVWNAVKLTLQRPAGHAEPGGRFG